jgi:hypothetical protein
MPGQSHVKYYKNLIFVVLVNTMRLQKSKKLFEYRQVMPRTILATDVRTENQSGALLLFLFFFVCSFFQTLKCSQRQWLKEKNGQPEVFRFVYFNEIETGTNNLKESWIFAKPDKVSMVGESKAHYRQKTLN